MRSWPGATWSAAVPQLTGRVAQARTVPDQRRPVYWGDCVRYEPVRAREQMSALTAAVADGKVAPIVSGRHPLERLQEALARVSARAVIGKRIVLI